MITLELSRRFVSTNTLSDLIKQYSPPSHGNSTSRPRTSISLPSALPSVLSLHEAVLQQEESESTPQRAINLLHELIFVLSSSLMRINLTKSNVTGRVFFRGKEVEISADEASQQSQICIEGKTARGEFVVRDDISELGLPEQPAASATANSAVTTSAPSSSSSPSNSRGKTYHYVWTRYNEAAKSFVRSFAELNWLQVAEINASECDLSGNGLSVMLCSTAASLVSLKINDCAQLDNSGIHSLVRHCRKLRVLEMSNCPLITEHGVMHLTQLPVAQIRQLDLLSCRQHHLSATFFTAFLHALEEKQFAGLLIHGDAVKIQRIKGNTNNPTLMSSSFLSPLQFYLGQHPDEVIDLSYTCITQQTLQQLSQEQQDFFTQRKRALIDSMDERQQQVYATMYKQPKWPFILSTISCPVYALDFSQHHYINDTILEAVLRRYGAQLYVLKLNNTFISSAGLAHLALAPNLRVLSLTSCAGIVDKGEANRVMMDACRNMRELMELSISDSKLSGRLLSSHPFLSLFAFHAHVSSVSWAAMRLLRETCALSLSVLSLAHCPYLNRRALFFILRMQRLMLLDISYCDSLRAGDVNDFVNDWNSDHCQRLLSLNVSGIESIDAEMSRKFSGILTLKKQAARTSLLGFAFPASGASGAAVEVMWNAPPSRCASNVSDSTRSSLLANLSTSQVAYELVQPPLVEHRKERPNSAEASQRFITLSAASGSDQIHAAAPKYDEIDQQQFSTAPNEFAQLVSHSQGAASSHSNRSSHASPMFDTTLTDDHYSTIPEHALNSASSSSSSFAHPSTQSSSPSSSFAHPSTQSSSHAMAPMAEQMNVQFSGKRVVTAMATPCIDAHALGKTSSTSSACIISTDQSWQRMPFSEQAILSSSLDQLDVESKFDESNNHTMYKPVEQLDETQW